jgi:hypothetical protein
MRKARVGGIAVAALLAATGIGLLAAAPAGADVNGGCSASLNGHNLNNVSISRGTYVSVGKDDVVPMTMNAPAGTKFSELHIYYTIAGADVDIYDAPANGDTWSHNVDIHSFARFGVGFYDLKGVGEFVGGGSCDGEALIKVTGDPLVTLAGDAGAGATVAGVLGMLGAGLAAKPGGDGGTGPGGAVTQQDVAKDEEHERDKARYPEDYNPEDAVDDATSGRCFLFGVVALIALPLLLLAGTGALAMAIAVPAVKAKQRSWPFALGAFSGLLTGLGAGVLLQEYAIVNPTRGYAIVYIAGGILFGLAVPALRRSLSR